jgi:hypothetical protein
MGAHARFHLQDGPQDVRVDTMALGGRHQAGVYGQTRRGLGFGRGLTVS